MFGMIKNLIILAVLALLIFGGWTFYKNYWPKIAQRGQQVQQQAQNIQNKAEEAQNTAKKVTDLKNTLEKGLQAFSSKNVDIKNMSFSPQSVNIDKGTAITWTNNDTVTHTVTGDGFDRTLKPGETFSYTFNDAGIYNYHCLVHPSMKGVITVK